MHSLQVSHRVKSSCNYEVRQLIVRNSDNVKTDVSVALRTHKSFPNIFPYLFILADRGSIFIRYECDIFSDNDL